MAELQLWELIALAICVVAVWGYIFIKDRFKRDI